jgi:predicted nucleic acid-binding protein
MSGYALDTNIITFLLKKDKKLQAKVYSEANEGQRVIIPPIAFYETKRGLLDLQATTKLSAFERLCDVLGVADMDMETLETAANIYVTLKQKGRLVEDADILIAASCIAHGYTLVTNNTKHFEHIESLRLVDWVQE